MSLNMQATMKSMLMTPDFEKRLAKVNGVVIASKIPQGGNVFKKRLKDSINRAIKQTVKQNQEWLASSAPRTAGTQEGFEATSSLVLSATVIQTECGGMMHCNIRPRLQGFGSQETKREGSQPEDYQIDNAAVDASGQDTFFPNSFNDRHPQPVLALADGLQLHNDDLPHIDPQSTSLNPSSVHLYDHHLEHLNPQLEFSYLNASDPPIRLDVLTNNILLSILQAWQDVIDDKGMQYALEHPRFQELMTELLERDVISADWKWTVNVEEVDMAFVRVLVEGRSP